MISLILKDLSVRLDEKKILDGINATFYGGEIVSVIGQNGSGKTTLLKAIAGICAHKGDVCVLDGVNELPNKVVRYMPQLTSVTSRLTVFEMVLLGLESELGWRVDQATFDRVDRMLHLLEIDHLAHSPVSSLSGGQKQLVFLAQAFISEPKVLLLDEPTSALDLRYQLVVMNAIRRYTETTGAVTLVVMHDLMNAARFCQKVMLLDDGGVLAHDTPEVVFDKTRLESVYEVKVSVEPSQSGFLNVIALEPVPDEHEHHH